MDYLLLFLEFCKIGALSFGGGYAVLPLIEETAVVRHGWIGYDALADLITISEITPGPIAVNAASFTGYTVGGIAGAVLATLGCILPSCVMMSVLAVLFEKFRRSTAFDSVLASIRPAVCALIFSAFVTVALLTFFGIPSLNEIGTARVNGTAILLFAGSFALCLTRKVPPMMLILLSGVLGVILL
ncbi:MAG: chromate transporter [Clostridia bacterium]|nr:chromate transporter [Clostridia bacterium]